MAFFTKKHVTDFDIQALVDNELLWEDAKEVMLFLESDAAAMKRYQELMEQKELLKAWAREI